MRRLLAFCYQQQKLPLQNSLLLQLRALLCVGSPIPKLLSLSLCQVTLKFAGLLRQSAYGSNKAVADVPRRQAQYSHDRPGLVTIRAAETPAKVYMNYQVVGSHRACRPSLLLLLASQARKIVQIAIICRHVMPERVQYNGHVRAFSLLQSHWALKYVAQRQTNDIDRPRH